MKILKSLFFIVLTLSLFSCGDDEGALEGTWNLESLDYSGTTTATTPIGPLVQSFTGVGENFNASINFGMTDYSSMGSYDLVLEITQLGMTQTTSNTVDEFLDTGTYVFEDPILTVTNTEGVQEVTISELTDKRMVMTINATESVTTPLPSTTVVNASYVLVR